MSWAYYADPRPDVQTLMNAPGSRVLDVGCGEGALGSALQAGAADSILKRHGLQAERLGRRFRLFEDQSRIGRVGALASCVARATLAPTLFPDLIAHHYVVLARCQ